MSAIICSDIDELTISLEIVKNILTPQLLKNDIVALYYGTERELNNIDWFGKPPKLINLRIVINVR